MSVHDQYGDCSSLSNAAINIYAVKTMPEHLIHLKQNHT
ncbi:hypothetical protein AOT82_1799 [Psychrobacter sp. AntiMn-1]|nr:hypothetical protein AOT82_1799 [Psychrobacter sp. AntiMn-1]